MYDLKNKRRKMKEKMNSCGVRGIQWSQNKNNLKAKICNYLRNNQII